MTLQMSTVNGAAALGMLDDIGTLENREKGRYRRIETLPRDRFR